MVHNMNAGLLKIHYIEPFSEAHSVVNLDSSVILVRKQALAQLVWKMKPSVNVVQCTNR